MAAGRVNWRLILNCSKRSGGLGAPPGPTPGEYQDLDRLSREAGRPSTRQNRGWMSRSHEAGGWAHGPEGTIGLAEAFLSRILHPQAGHPAFTEFSLSSGGRAGGSEPG